MPSGMVHFALEVEQSQLRTPRITHEPLERSYVHFATVIITEDLFFGNNNVKSGRPKVHACMAWRALTCLCTTSHMNRQIGYMYSNAIKATGLSYTCLYVRVYVLILMW